MDYEKMYKEALKRVRRLHDRMQVLSSTDALVASSELEFIFPELAESVDERIREELKEAFEAYDIESTWNGIPIRSIFAWLEKQKEQKQEWSEEDEKKITFLERLIRYNVPEGQYGWADGHKSGFITKSEAISKLKSLRPQPKRDCKDCAMFLNGKCTKPHWKPSEEQMKALTEEEKPKEEQMKALTEEEKPKEETPVEKERKRLEGNLKEEVCASDICAYRGKNVCTIKRDEYCPIFKPYKVRRNRNEQLG